MRKIDEIAKDVGVVEYPIRKSPKYQYAFYCAGKCICLVEDTPESKNLITKYKSEYVSERLPLVDEVYDKLYAEYSAHVENVNNIWAAELRIEYSHLSDEVYSICYDAAYDKGHAYGYDEIAGCMSGVVEFAEKIINAQK